MRWSKLKQQIEARFAEPLDDRLKVHLEKYRKPTRSENGELFLTLDDAKIFSASEFAALKATGGKLYSHMEHYEKYGVMTEFSAREALAKSLSLSITQMLDGSSQLLRALAVADERFGKRRLRALNRDAEPFVIQQILNARMK